MAQPLLQVKDLSVGFISGGRIDHAVINSSFSIQPGESIAIVGESGSGKSVTSLSMMQLLPEGTSIKGQALFCRNDGTVLDLINSAPEKMHPLRGKDIAMVFQEPMTSLNPVFTCGYQVMEAIQLHQEISAKEAKAVAISLFEKVQLPDPPGIFQRYPHQLSGGQKQRVMIAMAISCNPLLLIADEPTTALDTTVQKAILELLKELQRQNGMALLFITHDLGLVADIADTVLVMYKAEIVEQGKTAGVLKNPQHPYTRALLQCRPAMHKRGERLPVIQHPEPGSLYPVPRNLQPASTSSQTENILTVRDLIVSYPGNSSLFGKPTVPFKAVDNVSFTVSKGETVGLVGESGCGKTTLGKAILQLIQPASGEIILNGQEITGLSGRSMRSIRKSMQVVFQDPYGSLNPRLTVGNAITEPMKLHGLWKNDRERKDKTIELLRKVGLDAIHYDRYPHQFSGGQRQRVCIARALALDPSFLIFDESVSALDLSVQAQVLNLLNDLKAAFGFASVFISHDLSVVHYICDRIIVMDQGKLIEEGPSDEIFFSPKQPCTKRLLEAIPGRNLLERR